MSCFVSFCQYSRVNGRALQIFMLGKDDNYGSQISRADVQGLLFVSDFLGVVFACLFACLLDF